MEGPLKELLKETQRFIASFIRNIPSGKIIFQKEPSWNTISLIGWWPLFSSQAVVPLYQHCNERAKTRRGKSPIKKARSLTKTQAEALWPIFLPAPSSTPFSWFSLRLLVFAKAKESQHWRNRDINKFLYASCISPKTHDLAQFCPPGTEVRLKMMNPKSCRILTIWAERPLALSQNPNFLHYLNKRIPLVSRCFSW